MRRARAREKARGRSGDRRALSEGERRGLSQEVWRRKGVVGKWMGIEWEMVGGQLAMPVGERERPSCARRELL